MKNDVAAALTAVTQPKPSLIRISREKLRISLEFNNRYDPAFDVDCDGKSSGFKLMFKSLFFSVVKQREVTEKRGSLATFLFLFS